MKLLPNDTPPAEPLRRSLELLLAGRALGERQVAQTFQALAHGKPSSTLKAAVLTALASKGISPAEMGAFARAMLGQALGPVAHPGAILVDTCGTGGDGSGSFNLSSACALLVASLGIPVAKHGNRSISSRSGSADFYKALGIAAHGQPEQVERSLRESGFAFLFAPHFHPAMAGLAEVRRELGIRTIFNLLGPLVNPARPTHQLIGCTDSETGLLLAETLAQLDVQRAFVVIGAGGWDEATPCGPFQVFEVRGGEVRQRELLPEAFGIERCEPAQLMAGDAEHNVQLLMELFAGTTGALQDALVLNAALVLQLVEFEREPLVAAACAREALSSGRALRFLKELQRRGAQHEV